MNKPSLPALLVFVASVTTLQADRIDGSAYARSFDISFPGYTESETLTDFPILVRLSAARNEFDYSKCAANGADLRFTDASGNVLSSEVDTWNPGGESLVWVKVPSFKRSTVITAHYGCDNPVAVNPADVWSNGYLGVWHLNESSSPLADATGGGMPFTRSSSFASLVSLGGAGVLGNAPQFDVVTEGDNAHKGYLQLQDSGNKFAGMSTMTIEMWIFQREIANNKRLMYRKTGSVTAFDFYLQYPDYSQRSKLSFNFNTTNTLSQVASVPRQPIVRHGEEGIGVWRHFALVYDSVVAKKVLAYVNGENSASSDDSVTVNEGYCIVPNGGDIKLGNLGGPQAFPGGVDELRISGVARSAAWVKATYDSVHDEDFAAFTLPSDWGMYSHTFSVAFPGYAGSETLTNFPVLVKVSTNGIPGFSYADCLKGNGGDLRFADANGTLLDSEVDTWDPDGESLVWVKVPSFAASTAIKAFYGWDEAPEVDARAVWTNGYIAVWHLNETGTTMTDSTCGGTSLAQVQANSILSGQPGIVGNAVEFDKLTNHKGGLATADARYRLAGASSFTIELWAIQDVFDPTNNPLNRYAVYLSELNAETSKIVYRFYDANTQYGTNGKTILTFTDSTGTTRNPSTGNVVPPRGQWNYQVARYDGSQYVIKLNGVQRAQGNYPDFATANQTSLCVGNTANASGTSLSPYAYPGKIDEVRISRVPRSDDWIQASYDAVKTPSFASYSSAKENTLGLIFIYQ